MPPCDQRVDQPGQGAGPRGVGRPRSGAGTAGPGSRAASRASYAGAPGSSRCAPARAAPSYRAGRRRRRRCRSAAVSAPRTAGARATSGTPAACAGDMPPSWHRSATPPRTEADAASIGAWLVSSVCSPFSQSWSPLLAATQSRGEATLGGDPPGGGGDTSAQPGKLRAQITFTKNTARPWRSAISWDAARQRADGSWTVLAHDSWRAGSGLPGGQHREHLREGARLAAERHLLPPAVRRLPRQPDPRPGFPAQRQALPERDPARTAVHPHRGRRRQHPVCQRHGRPAVSLGVPEDQRLHLARLHQDVAGRDPRPHPRLPPLLPRRRPLLHRPGPPRRPLTEHAESAQTGTQNIAESAQTGSEMAPSRQVTTRRTTRAHTTTTTKARPDRSGRATWWCWVCRTSGLRLELSRRALSSSPAVVGSSAGAGGARRRGGSPESSPSTTSRCLEM